jgi:hypothetical protein
MSMTLGKGGNPATALIRKAAGAKQERTMHGRGRNGPTFLNGDCLLRGLHLVAGGGGAAGQQRGRDAVCRGESG